MLPEDIRGQWIWHHPAAGRVEECRFFRREFILDETPASAELWITARTFFHVYVNGRHLGYGPTPCPTGDAYVTYIDANFLLQTGLNVLAVLAHNTRVTRGNCRQQESGLWCQLNIDGSPAVWTDRSWQCLAADCYGGQRPRRNPQEGFTEHLDMRHYPSGWTEEAFDAAHWTSPDQTTSLSEAAGRLLPLEQPEFASNLRECGTIAAQGTWRQTQADLQITFSHLSVSRGPGVYAAETFFHSDKAKQLEARVFCDDAYRIFLNEACIKEQGVESICSGVDPRHRRPLCFAQGELVDPELTLDIQAGWNRLVFYQQVELDSAGIALVLTNMSNKDVTMRRRPALDAPEGTSLVGPFRSPLARTAGFTDLETMHQFAYVPIPQQPVDTAAFFMSCRFASVPVTESRPGYPMRLGQSSYVILDLGATQHGCPELLFSGRSGDIIDIVCGERIEDDVVPFRFDQCHAVDTVVLAEQPQRWICVEPRGVRYLMLVVRKSVGSVSLENAGLRALDFTFPNAGRFECSDKLLQSVWETGRRTLSACVQGRFLEAPARSRNQSLTGAIPQTWAAYYTFGSFDLAGRVIEEFAQGQLESGETPTTCCDDRYMNMADISLLWPVWLQRHYMYTGDRQLLLRMIPTLRKFFAYFAHCALPGQELLGDLACTQGATYRVNKPSGAPNGVITGLNALYCRSLLSGAWLCEEAQLPKIAQALRERAGKLASEVRVQLWNVEKGLFSDCKRSGELSAECSWETNVLAIYGGVASADLYEEMFDRLFLEEAPYHLDDHQNVDDPLLKHFLLETAFALGRRHWCLGLLRHYWGGMVNSGARTWWERFDSEEAQKPSLQYSLCHGAGTFPSAYLCRELAGIRPAVPGFTTAIFDPVLTGAVDWVRVEVPTIHGHIMAEWRLSPEKQLEVALDASFPVEIAPILDPAISETATFHVSDDVTILAPENLVS